MQISRGVKVKKSHFTIEQKQENEKKAGGENEELSSLSSNADVRVTLICQCFSVIECKIRRFKNIKCPP